MYILNIAMVYLTIGALILCYIMMSKPLELNATHKTCSVIVTAWPAVLVILAYFIVKQIREPTDDG